MLLVNLNKMVYIILFVLGIFVSKGLISYDEEFLIMITMLIVFFTLVEGFKKELTKSIEINAVIILEFINYELIKLYNNYNKLGIVLIYFLSLRIKYRFWYVLSYFLYNTLEIISKISKNILKCYIILSLEDKIRNFIILEQLTKRLVIRKSFDFSNFYYCQKRINKKSMLKKILNYKKK